MYLIKALILVTMEMLMSAQCKVGRGAMGRRNSIETTGYHLLYCIKWWQRPAIDSCR